MKKLKNYIYIKEKIEKDEDETIENIDDFGTIDELNNEILNKLKNKKINNIKITNISKVLKKGNPKLTHSLTNNIYSLSNINQTDKIQTSNKKKNISIKIKRKKFISPISPLQNLDDNNNINSYYTSKKSIFSKISENLYNSCKANLSTSNKILHNKTEEVNYNKLTEYKYLLTAADKENYQNNKISHNYTKLNLKNNNKFRKFLNRNNNLSSKNFFSEGNNETLKSSSKIINKKIRTPKEFWEDQKKYKQKQQKHIEKITNEQNKIFNQSMKNKPTISYDSRRIANELKNNEEKNVFYKLYKDFSKRQKNKEEMRKKSFKEYNSGLGIISNKKLSKILIKQNSDRLYKEYLQKESFIKENERKQNNKLKIMALTKYMNKNSNIILFSKFLNKYKNILISEFNKTIEDEFEINFDEYLKIIMHLGIINNDDILLLKKEAKKNKIYNIKLKFQNISHLWKNKNNYSYTYIKNKQNKKDNNNLKYKNKNEYKLIKESWKIITKVKNFNREALGISNRLLLFLLDVLGINNSNLNNSFIKNECLFLINNNIDTNLSRQIFRNFLIFRKLIFDNLLSKNINNDKVKISTKLNDGIKSSKYKTINNAKNIYLKNKNQINEKDNKYKYIYNAMLTKNLKRKVHNNYYFNTEIISRENSSFNIIKDKVNKSEKKYTKLINNSKIKEYENIHSFPIKRLKRIFQIKIGDDIKKLVIYNGDNELQKLEEFCKTYNLEQNKKEKLIREINNIV